MESEECNIFNDKRNQLEFGRDDMWSLRYEVLAERKRELQKENAELRRQLAGVTPNCKYSYHSTPSCSGCLNLKRQKSRQAKFFEHLLLESRRNAANSKKECEKLSAELNNTRAELIVVKSNFKTLIDQQSEKMFMYKSRSERLEKRNKFELKGYLKEIDNIKSKLIQIDTTLAKIQLKVLNKTVEHDLMREVRRLTSDSLSISEKLRNLSGKLRPTWLQCVTVWHARNIELSTMNSSIHPEPFLSSSTYTLISISSISFIPLVIIITSYLMSAIILHRVELAPSRNLLPQVVVTGEGGSLVSSSEDRSSWTIIKQLERSTPKVWPKIKQYDATPDSTSLSAMGTKQQTIVVLSNGIQSIRRKTIRTNLVLLSSYVLCWLPYNISNLWHVYSNSCNNVGDATKFACAFIVLNAILNPFLYGIVSVDICQHGHEKRNSQL